MKISYPDNEEFFAIPFYVDSRVFTPRNDTEIMIYQVLKVNFDNFTLIDVGTGSGAIPIAILKNSKSEIKKAFALDISQDALEVAKINIKKHNLQNKLKLIKSDLLEIFLNKKEKITSKNLVITANLPYIKNGDFKNIDKEVLQNDPHIALFGGEETGFELYEKFIQQVFELKNLYNIENLLLFIEIGFDQKEYSKQYLSSLGLKFEYFKDLNNIDRIIKIDFN